MPIFEYRCGACGHMVERIQRTSSEEIECPACGKPARRVVSAFSGTASGSCGVPAGSGFS